MASELDICNLALQWLGQDPITNLLAPTNRPEQLCALNYPLARRAVLEASEWSFATKRIESDAPITPNQSWGFSYSHPLPSACIRMLTVRDNPYDGQANGLQWQIENRLVLTDAPHVYMRYLEDVTDATRFSPAFVQALAARLASEIAIPITENAQLHSTMVSLYTMKLTEASNLDSLQGRARRVRASRLTTRR